jgi:hypothetical protein
MLSIVIQGIVMLNVLSVVAPILSRVQICSMLEGERDREKQTDKQKTNTNMSFRLSKKEDNMGDT